MRPILSLDQHNTGGAYVYALTPYSYNRIGNSIGGTALTTTNATYMLRQSCTVQYGDTIYVFVGDTIKKLNRSTNDWDTVATVTGQLSGNDTYKYLNKMHLVYNGGKYYLALMYAGSSSTTSTNIYIRGAVYDLEAGTLTVSSGQVVVSNGGGGVNNAAVGHSIVFGNTMYAVYASNRDSTQCFICSMTIPNASITGNYITFGYGAQTQFCIWQNALYILYGTTAPNDGTGSLRLGKNVGGAWVLQTTVATNYNDGSTIKHCLFTNGTYLYLLARQTTSDLWKLWRWNGTSLTDVTSATIGTQFNSIDNGGFRWTVDQHSDPANPIIYLMWSASFAGGYPWSFYRFIDESTPVEYIGSAGDSSGAIALSSQEQGGGELSFSLGEMNIQIHDELESGTSVGNTKLYFRIYESNSFPSGTPVEVKFFVCDTSESFPGTPMRLAVPSDGSIYNSYTIQGITAGSGTLYSVEWRSSVDGYTAGDGVKILGSVSGVL